MRELALAGIQNSTVLQAMDLVPRHFFLDSAFVEMAYENMAFPISVGQTISAPMTVALQSQLLQASPGMKILEIGTGSGYQTAVLHHMGLKIYSIERQKVLHDQAKRILAELKVKAHLVYGDGYKGLPTYGPFDRILVTCACPTVPEALLLQLAPHGRMVVPFGEGEEQSMMVIYEDHQGEFVTEVHGKCAFVPMLPDRNPRKFNG